MYASRAGGGDCCRGLCPHSGGLRRLSGDKRTGRNQRPDRACGRLYGFDSGDFPVRAGETGRSGWGTGNPPVWYSGSEYYFYGRIVYEVCGADSRAGGDPL